MPGESWVGGPVAQVQGSGGVRQVRAPPGLSAGGQVCVTGSCLHVVNANFPDW